MSDRSLQLRLEFQRNPVADEVSAITAVVRPILQGILYALKADVVAEVGGYQNVKVKMLPRLHRPGDGDCGLCFEYAIHDAMNRREPTVQERLLDAMSNHCRVPGGESASILFGAEKSGALKLIDTAKERLTNDSRLLAGYRGQPVKLRKHIEKVAAALKRKDVRDQLPWSISGLWKADLFVGFTDSDRWVGTSVKVNPRDLEPGRGLRIGIVPSREGRSDTLRMDDERNLVICPIPHDGAFMEVFYNGWKVVQQFLAADADVPKEVALPRPPERQVARYLAERRDFPVGEVIEVLGPLAQPELLETSERKASLVDQIRGEEMVGAVVAPMANSTS